MARRALPRGPARLAASLLLASASWASASQDAADEADANGCVKVVDEATAGYNVFCREVGHILYSGFNGSGHYDDVTAMLPDGTCEHEPRPYSGTLAPLDEDLSIHVRGPCHLLAAAVYVLDPERSPRRHRRLRRQEEFTTMTSVETAVSWEEEEVVDDEDVAAPTPRPSPPAATPGAPAPAVQAAAGDDDVVTAWETVWETEYYYGDVATADPSPAAPTADGPPPVVHAPAEARPPVVETVVSSVTEVRGPGTADAPPAAPTPAVEPSGEAGSPAAGFREPDPASERLESPPPAIHPLERPPPAVQPSGEARSPAVDVEEPASAVQPPEGTRPPAVDTESSSTAAAPTLESPPPAIRPPKETRPPAVDTDSSSTAAPTLESPPPEETRPPAVDAKSPSPPPSPSAAHPHREAPASASGPPPPRPAAQTTTSHARPKATPRRHPTASHVGPERAVQPGGSWSRIAYYHARHQIVENMSFLGNYGGQNSGVWDDNFGNSLAYLRADATGGSDSPRILEDKVIPSNHEFAIFSAEKCDDSCGYSRASDVAYKGFGGANKVFLLRFQMPLDDERGFNGDKPAIWLLNGRIPRTAQYNACSCWTTHCGEVDVFEVLMAGDLRCKSTFHIERPGGSSDWFRRPVDGHVTVAVVFHERSASVSIRVLPELGADGFAESLEDEAVRRWVHDMTEQSGHFHLAAVS